MERPKRSRGAAHLRHHEAGDDERRGHDAGCARLLTENRNPDQERAVAPIPVQIGWAVSRGIVRIASASRPTLPSMALIVMMAGHGRVKPSDCFIA